MELPKGTLKGLARVVAPLSFWMAAGWAAYPTLIKKIMDAAGETVNMNEINPFSLFMVIACIVAGTVLAVYGFTGNDATDAELLALAKRETLCPYCGKNLPEGSVQCPGCGNKIPQF
ncbi:MAG: hypothetical protein KKH41_03425 [Candidatus Thermoplasmatota archaeon]|nr:hypothetical protein [Euryarchaeota archaeon]MBU4032388.1 hypothetical protein [Candidatus Thermoplasmatota archaeon]MBU4071123.1 hypothetical protein [Candidatus Thermoplasmatota archaeon]MBU4144813.1 hypothetical protein [Candidatus Thermoplasmatota archaeon]MBU4591617.1 hypothetical protein [Candidatus Thermoplasmatota archaeon]